MAKTIRGRSTEDLVLHAYSGGATKHEARSRMRKKRRISDSLEEKIRADLMAAGRMGDLDKGIKGPVAHRFIPVDEVPVETEKVHSAPQTSTAESGNGQRRLERSNPIASAMAKEIINQSLKIMGEISEGAAWRKKRRIQKICDWSIHPLLNQISMLNRTTQYHAPDAIGYFKEEHPLYWNGSLGRRVDLRGTKSIPAPGTYYEVKGGHFVMVKAPDCATEDGYIRPTLLDWSVYLSDVISELQEQLWNDGAGHRESQRGRG